MLAYIGTNEILIIGALFVFVVAPFVLIVFLALRKQIFVAASSREVADLREEVGRLREQIARSDAAKQSKPDTPYSVPVTHDPGSAQRVGQR